MMEERGHCWSLGAVGGWGGAGILGQEHRGPGGKARGLRAGQGADVAAEPWKEVVSGCSFAQGSRRRE